VIAVLAILVGLGGGGFVVYQKQEAARLERERANAKPPPPPPPPEPVVSVEPPPPPTHTADPPPSASIPKKPAGGGAAPAASIDPDKRAYLDATGLPPGRKIIVDGRVMGSSPRKIAVHCGTHRVQIGDNAPEAIDFPCGGEVSFSD
jgi:hypothetical protein